MILDLINGTVSTHSRWSSILLTAQFQLTLDEVKSWRKSFLVVDRKMLTLHCQYHGFWWPGDARSQGIGSNGINTRQSISFSLWRHRMETFSALLALCTPNSPVTGEFLSQRPVTRSFGVSLICTSTSGGVNNQDTSYYRRHRAHYDVIVTLLLKSSGSRSQNIRHIVVTVEILGGYFSFYWILCFEPNWRVFAYSN